MRLKVLVPDAIVLDAEVHSLVAEGEDGHFGLKHRHIDFVSALSPGLLYYQREGDAEGEYLAVDRGILVKQGETVTISVRNAGRTQASNTHATRITSYNVCYTKLLRFGAFCYQR